MAEYVAFDEDGNERIGWVQDQNNSCGPACIYCVEMTLRLACIVDGEQRIRELLTNYFSAGPIDFIRRKVFDFNNDGISIDKIAKALRREGYPCSLRNTLPSPLAESKFPLIAHVAWSAQSGHFVVLAGVTSTGKAVVLDPWYGLQQIAVQAMPTYTALQNRQTVCSVPAGGRLSGWCVVLS